MVKILKNMRARDWLLIAVSVVFITAQVWLDLKIPDYMSEITTLVETEGSEMSDILTAGGKMLLCALASLVSALVVGFFAARVAADFSMRLRERVYGKVMDFSMQEINRFSISSLITRSTNDITQIQMVIAMGMQVVIKAPIMAILAIEKISTKSWQWSALTAGMVLLILVVILFIMWYALPKFKKIQWLTDNLNRVTRENLTGLQVVRAYNAESYQEAKFEKANFELTDNNLKAHLAMSVMNPTMNLVMNGLTLGIYWIGATLISSIAVQSMADVASRLEIFSDMVVFMSYSMQVIMAFMMLIVIFIMLPRAAVSANRINEILDTETAIRDGTVTAPENGLEGEIEFRDVSFRYPDAVDDVLHHISFRAHKGETVAFIGATGSGKSTLVNLVPRFYDATEGEVLVDGVNVRDYTQDALHDKIGYVPQKSFLFSGTVEGNVLYGEDVAPREEAQRAVRIAQAKDFVEREDVGYDGAVAQAGANFSGGQKQRLSIARAVAKHPEIYIFDDSFSALDYKTDRVLRTALKRESAGVTTLIVAQRIGTIRDADRIIVLEHGHMAGMGTHEELMKTCDVYREIAYSQLSKEELGE